MSGDGDGDAPAPEIIQLAAYLARAAGTPAKRPARPHGPPKPIHLPDGRTIAPGELAELWDGAFTDPERIHLITRGRDGAYRVDPRGFPLALAYSSPEHVDAGGAGDGARITLAWSNRRETFGEHTVSLRDVNSADYLDRFGSPPISTRKEQARFADILKAQLPALPLRLTPALSGWSISPAGRSRFVLEDRASWYQLNDAGQVQLDAPGRAEPAAPTLEDAAFLVNAWSEWAPDGRGVAALAFTIRGLFASLKPVGSSLVLTGESASGKTTPAKFCLGVLGAVSDRATPTVTFTASAAAMKPKRAWRNDLPSVFDDFHKLANSGAQARVWDALDAIFRAVADGDEWNARATRTGGLREPTFLKGADIFTGELIEGFLASAERRIAWIGCLEDRPSDEIYAAWDALQAIWERIGHAVIRWALPVYALPGDMPGEKLRHYLERLDAACEASMYATLSEAMPAAPQKFTRSIARSWAVMLSGASLADQAIGAAEGDGPFLETLRPVLARLALRQLERLTNGAGTAAFDADFFRLALTPDNLLLDAETGEPFKSDDPADIRSLMPIGYQWNAALGFMVSGRQFTGWRHRGRGEDWLLPDAFLLACQRRARTLNLEFPFTYKTLSGHLARIGYTLPGNDGRDVYKAYLPGPRQHQERVLRIPIAADPETIATEQALEAGLLARPAISGLSSHNPTTSIVRDETLGLKNVPKSNVLPAEKPNNPNNPTKKRSRAGARSAAHATVALDREGAAIGYGSSIATEPHHAASDPSRVKKARGPKKGEALAALLDWAKTKGAAQVFITRSWAQAADLPADKVLPDSGVAHLWAALPANSAWELTEPGVLGRTMRAKSKAGGRKLDLMLPCYDHRIELGDETAHELASSLALFQEATAGNGRRGFPYRQSPGATFQDIWLALSRDSGALDITQDLAPAAFPAVAHATPEPAADFGWRRAPTDAERQAASCIVIDGNSQYLRAMAGLRVGLGAPVRLENPAFDPSRSGYWRLTYDAPAWPATLPAAGWPLQPGVDGWLPTETVTFLTEIGATLEISEAHLWERNGRALDRLQTRLRDGLYQLTRQKADDATGAAGALQLIKTTYKIGVGQWSIGESRSREGPDATHRPHWRHAIMARSNALLLRDLHTRTGGLHPFAIKTDACAFLTDRPADELGLKIGPQLGAYKIERHAFPAAAMIGALDELEAAKQSGDRHRIRDAHKAVSKLIDGED